MKLNLEGRDTLIITGVLLAIVAVICLAAGWSTRGWWEHRKPQPVPAVAGPVAPVPPAQPVQVKYVKGDPYVPPEFGIDMAKLKKALTDAAARERAWCAAWIEAVEDTLLVQNPPYPIVWEDLYQEWAMKYFKLAGKTAPEIPAQLTPTPSQSLASAIKQFGVGFWPGFTGLGAEWGPETGLNYTCWLTADLVVLHRARLGIQGNIREAGANVGYHLPIFRNTYVRVLANKRFDLPGMAPDTYGLGLGTQF